MPARRLAALAAAVTTVAAAAAGPAYATGGGTASPAEAKTGTSTGTGTGTGANTTGTGKAGAVVLRTGLDVSLLSKTVHVPLRASLNEVQAPAGADKTALTVTLNGVDQGKPVDVLRADAATARATADRTKAEAYANLARARVHVPGLPLLSLVEVEKVTSRAVCTAGGKPTAASNLLGAVTVLGKKVTLTTAGTTKVEVPGVGEVRLDLSRTGTTSRTAAATALRLKVSVNPLRLNVAGVRGELTLAEATCETPPGAAHDPAAKPKPEPEPKSKSKSADSASAPAAGPQTVAHKAAEPAAKDLAATGGSSATPYVAGGAALLVAAGAGALVVTRRRSAARRGD
ncbi:SCO1860 family LAETG-anchored protein [Streptomyces roseifaciens]|uniref:SCO1860 family LAETG-anchored protein n=1 Tax=Streptomyces roseifaciens TaxID=1488406 RepID=UPI0007180311|nr:SCO1860 family LAETG-anchored protein [Streptomyces roseifaciens]